MTYEANSMRPYVSFHAQSAPRGLLRWNCGEGNEMHAARVHKFGSKCAIHTAFFAKRTTIDASITEYHRYEKALGVMPRRREGAIGAVCRPRRPANINDAKTEGAITV